MPKPLLSMLWTRPGPQLLPGVGRAGGGRLTLGIGADEGGEVSEEGEWREVGKVCDLQGMQEGAEALSTESEVGSGKTGCRGGRMGPSPSEHTSMAMSLLSWGAL